MDDGRHGAARWQRSSRCYAGNCVEVSAHDDSGVVLLRDSKHPQAPAIAVAFSDWSVFMDLVRDAEWGESFDLVSTAAAGLSPEGRPVGAGRQTSRVLV